MFASSRVIGTGAGLLEIRMRTSILAMVVVAGSAIAFQATAQQAAPSDLTKEQIQQRDVEKGLKTSEPQPRASFFRASSRFFRANHWQHQFDTQSAPIVV